MSEQAGYRTPPNHGLIMGIDPGPTESAYAIVRPDYSLVKATKAQNYEVKCALSEAIIDQGVRVVVIEGLACYARPVGRETFETAYMVGDLRTLVTVDGAEWLLYDRPTYANAIAGTNKVTDAMLYQALRLRFGDANKGGPLYGLRGNSDLRSAYALAVFHLDCLAHPERVKKGRK